MKIDDGTGKGYQAKVNSSNFLEVTSVSRESCKYSNIVNGKAWNLIASATPSGAGSIFFYFKNTGTTTYIFNKLFIRINGAEEVKITLGRTGTPSGGSTVTPVALNTGSANTPNATIQSANAITGLSGGSTAFHFVNNAASTATQTIDLTDFSIVVEPGGVLSMNGVSGSVAIVLNAIVYEAIEL